MPLPTTESVVSNLLGFPASGEPVVVHWVRCLEGCFQFIGFPSEWGAVKAVRYIAPTIVSNLLGFPASGEVPLLTGLVWLSRDGVSNLLGFPASGELIYLNWLLDEDF